jgi:hypothetical protein
MALDTRGLASGFGQGFGLADQYYARQHRQGLQDQQNERADKQSERADESFDMQKQQFAGQQEDAQRNRSQEQAKFTLGKVAQGVDLSQDEMTFLKENPQYWPALDPETDTAIENAQRVIDPNDELGANSPEALYSMNLLFGHRVNRGEGGKKRIAGMYPGQSEGSVALDLEVEGPDGKKYNAPMTRNRGVAGADDEVLETPVGSIVDQVQGYRMLRNAFQGPEAQQSAARVLAALRGDQGSQTKGININGYLVNPVTGEQRGDYRTADQKAGRSANNRPPAIVQTAEWMVRSGIAGTLEEAYAREQEARSDPARFVANYVDQELKAQKEAFIYPEDEGYLTTEQMREKAIGVFRAIRQSTSGSAPAQEAPMGIQVPGATAEDLPRDGSAMKQEDGSYSGRINRDPQQSAPAQGQADTSHDAALDILRKNPDLAPQFKERFGYLPEGF